MIKNSFHKIIILILLIILLSIFDKYRYVNDIISFAIILLLTREIMNNNYYSLGVTIIIFMLLKSINIEYSMENFEGGDNSSNDENKKPLKGMDIDTDAPLDTNAVITTEKEQPKNENVKQLDDLVKQLSGASNPIKLSDKDLNEKNELDNDYQKVIDGAIKAEHNPSNIQNKNASELSPFEAQKETFALINTVQQLSSTVKELGPVLQEGKKVLDLYKHFKF